ncbi:hypothetical protein IHE44_0004831, partial [Lamprotornis superbus]
MAYGKAFATGYCPEDSEEDEEEDPLDPEFIDPDKEPNLYPPDSHNHWIRLKQQALREGELDIAEKIVAPVIYSGTWKQAARWEPLPFSVIKELQRTVTEHGIVSPYFPSQFCQQYIDDILMGGDEIEVVGDTQQKIISHLESLDLQIPSEKIHKPSQEVKFLGICWKGVTQGDDVTITCELITESLIEPAYSYGTGLYGHSVSVFWDMLPTWTGPEDLTTEGFTTPPQRSGPDDDRESRGSVRVSPEFPHMPHDCREDRGYPKDPHPFLDRSSGLAEVDAGQ